MTRLLFCFGMLFCLAAPAQAAMTWDFSTMNTFEWLPTECAPNTYPMFIVRGDLILPNQKSLSIPDKRPLYNGWGTQGSMHIVGDKLKPLPTQMALTWFSYTEDRFYAGKFELPVNKLLELFRAGTASPEGVERLPFDRIIVGMAPGGDISVWAGARRIVKEIATFRAQPADLPWSSVLNHPTITRAEYIAMQLKRALSPEELKRVQSIPVPAGRWALFATRFPWIPRLGTGATGRDLWIKGLNGEVEWLDLTGTRKDADPPPMTRSAPRELSLDWRTAGGQNLTADITLDADESMAAFAKLASVAGSEPLSLLLEPSDMATTVDVSLQRGKIAYRFERSTVKVYKARN